MLVPDSLIKFPLAAAMLAAMGSVNGGPGAGRGERVAGEGCDACLVARAEVPEAALSAIVREAGGLDFGPVTVHEREGSVIYTADMVRDGHPAGVEVDSSGGVQSVTTEIEAWELPVAVRRMADAETLGFPSRAFAVRESAGVRTYTVDAATLRRGKRLEISEVGEVLSKELKIG